MITKNISNEVISDNLQQVNTFKIKQTGAALRILSDLYSDKHLAIVRELGCNAADSHTAAGKRDMPFDVHLPNAIEPWFSIKDYGIGISHENIYNIYATYFESTKTKTNDQVGCLGLGSKSPFCYADTFTITSIHDGVKSNYNAYLNEQNTPSIAFMGSSNTEEFNGVEIKIPVASSDFTLFANAVKKAFAFFKVKPNILGGIVEWKDMTPSISGNGWDFYKRHIGNNYAIMGGIAYPINQHQLDYKYSSLLRRESIVLYFDMGELEFTPSREELSYTKATIAALQNKLDIVIKEIPEFISKAVESQENIVEALKLVRTIHQDMYYIVNCSTTKFFWNGNDITDPHGFIANISGDVTTYDHKSGRYGMKGSCSTSTSVKVNSEWFFDDAKASISRVRHYVSSNRDKKVTLFSKEAMHKLISFGFPTDVFSPTSSLPKPEIKRNPRQNAPKKGDEIKLYFIGDYWKQVWKPENVSINNLPKYFIVKQDDCWDFQISIKNPDIKKCYTKSTLKNLINFFNLLERDVAMVKSSQVEFLVKNGCVKFEDFANSKFDDFSKESLRKYKCAEYVLSHDAKKILHSSDLDDNHPVKIKLKEISEIVESGNKYKNMACSIHSCPKHEEIFESIGFEEENKHFNIVLDLLSSRNILNTDNKLIIEMIKSMKK